MAVYMIAYDLNSPGQNYKNLKEEIKNLGSWCHYLESTYLVSCSLSINAVSDLITKHLDSSDRLILCKVEKPIKGWLSEKQWDWIRENL